MLPWFHFSQDMKCVQTAPFLMHECAFHPFFLGRKASISKKAFGRVFIFSLISSRVPSSSSDGPALHLVGDKSWLTQPDVCVSNQEGLFIPLCVHMYICMWNLFFYIYIQYINMKTYLFSRWDTSFSLLRWLEMEEEHLSWSLEISSSFCRYSLCVSWTRRTRVTSATTWRVHPCKRC